jgi:hypothetical protein
MERHWVLGVTHWEMHLVYIVCALIFLHFCQLLFVNLREESAKELGNAGRPVEKIIRNS